MTREALAHAVIDALERAGTAQEYYRLNHIPHDQVLELADLVAGWCLQVGIQVEPDPASPIHE